MWVTNRSLGNFWAAIALKRNLLSLEIVSNLYIPRDKGHFMIYLRNPTLSDRVS